MADTVPSINTKRLLLRNINLSDTRNIVLWRSDPNVYRYFLTPKKLTESEHESWYRNRYLKDESVYNWMALDQENHPVGVFGVKRESANSTTAEVSYILSPESRGKGYAGEAVQQLFHFLKYSWNCKDAIAEIHEENGASIHFAEKNGMTCIDKRGEFLIYTKQLKKKLTVFIRADGNSQIGTGHIMRCLAIAGQLHRLGIEAVFVTADRQASHLIIERGYLNVVLDSDWKNMEAETDSFMALLPPKSTNVVLVDSYFVTKAYFEQISRSGRIFYIDDLNKETYPVAGLINYNIYGPKEDYSGYVIRNTKLLLGPSYAPLRDEFSDNSQHVYRGVKKILVTSGGTDEYNFIGNFLEAVFHSEDLNKREYYCILGIFNKNTKSLLKKYGSFPNIHLLQNVNNMSFYMKMCDMAVTAGGTTIYEICASGLPSVLYTLADNQLQIARTFADQGIIPWAGDIRENMSLCIQNIEDLIEQYSDRSLWEQKSAQLHSIVDGKGAYRVAKELIKQY